MKRAIVLSGLLFWATGAFPASYPTATMLFVSFDGVWVNGIPTYPYSIQVGANGPQWMMCDDYYHDGAPGDQWPAYVTNLADPHLDHLRFGSFGIDAYQEAGWIFLETGYTPSSEWPDMNYAVWHIFNPTVPIDSNSQFWIDQAILNHTGVDYSYVWIATPVKIDAPPTGDQELLFYWNNPLPPNPPNPPNPVPDPGSFLLLAAASSTGFCALHRGWKR